MITTAAVMLVLRLIKNLSNHLVLPKTTYITKPLMSKSVSKKFKDQPNRFENPSLNNNGVSNNSNNANTTVLYKLLLFLGTCSMLYKNKLEYRKVTEVQTTSEIINDAVCHKRKTITDVQICTEATKSLMELLQIITKHLKK